MSRWSLTRRFRVAAALALAAAALTPCVSRAADTITFSVPNLTLFQESNVQTGFFDAVVSDSGTDTITGFTIDVTTSGPVTLIDADDQTQLATAGGTYTYLFRNDSADDPSFNGSHTSYSLNNQNWFLNDAATDNGTVLTSGAPLGLLRIEYSIPAFFTGTVDLDITAYAQNQAFGAIWGDTSYNANVPTIVNGSIFIPSPEPGSLALLLIGAAGWFGIRRLRARRASR